MTNLAVIGGGGFFGTNLIERCSSHKVLYLDRVPYPKWTQRPSVFEERIGDATDLAAVLPICRSADIAWLRAGTLGGARSNDIDHAAQYFDTNVTSVVTILRVFEVSQCQRWIFLPHPTIDRSQVWFCCDGRPSKQPPPGGGVWN